jgi:hypothetical protein
MTEELQALPVEMLSEFFSKPAVFRSMFGLATEFERQAYAVEFQAPDKLTTELKSLLGLLLDFHSVERAKFFETVRA